MHNNTSVGRVFSGPHIVAWYGPLLAKLWSEKFWYIMGLSRTFGQLEVCAEKSASKKPWHRQERDWTRLTKLFNTSISTLTFTLYTTGFPATC